MIFKKVKRYLSIALFAVLCLGLIACNNNNENDTSTKEINTKYTDELKLTSDFEGKDFLSDGIGEVTLTQNVDGDTAHFKSSSGRIFTARFLGINTPESTGRIDAWGKAASKFTSETLTKASENGSIVLESEVIGSSAVLDATNTRYLAYVWYRFNDTDDFRLLNLEIVENCYSTFTGGDLKYINSFNSAHLKSYNIGKRVYGENDPTYDYSRKVIEVTIAEIKNNFDLYSGGSKLKITARVMRLSGDNLYLEDLNETFNEETNKYELASIYMFSGYGSGLSILEVGTVISLECQVVDNEIYGRQLTYPKNVRIVENPDGSEVEIQTIPTDVTTLEKYEGFVVKLTNVLITGKNKPNEEGAYTIYAKMENGSQVNLRIDGSAYPKYPYDDVEVGQRYDVIGGVSKFNDTYQVMIGNNTGSAKNDLLKK